MFIDGESSDMVVVSEAASVKGVQLSVPGELELPMQNWSERSIESLVDERERGQLPAVMDLEGRQKQPGQQTSPLRRRSVEDRAREPTRERPRKRHAPPPPSSAGARANWQKWMMGLTFPKSAKCRLRKKRTYCTQYALKSSRCAWSIGPLEMSRRRKSRGCCALTCAVREPEGEGQGRCLLSWNFAKIMPGCSQRLPNEE